MNYSEFLFNKLQCEFSGSFNELPYDEQFDKTKLEYAKFESSEYNETNKNEYCCIERYLVSQSY